MVLQADQDWAWFISVEKPDRINASAVKAARNTYEQATATGSEPGIRKAAAENYIRLVTELMMPLLVIKR